MSLLKCWITFLSIGAVPSCCLAVERAYTAQRNEVMTFDMSGNLLNSFSTVDDVQNIAVNRNGEIFVLTLEVIGSDAHNVIEKFDSQGNSLGQIVSVNLGSSANFLGRTVGSDQTIYVGKNGVTDTIEHYTQSGDYLGTFATISTPVPGAPFAIVFDSFENMYVPDDNLIEKFDSNGQTLGVFAIAGPPPLTHIFDLDLNSLENLYAAILADSVQVFDSAGTLLNEFDPEIDIRAIAIDSKDILYVAGDGSGGTLGSVKMFLSDGTSLGTFVSGLSGEPIDMIFATVVPEPSSLGLVMLLFGGAVATSLIRRDTLRSEDCASRLTRVFD
jgi:hypothetical protein